MNKKNFALYISVFAITAVTFTAVLAALHIYPFGKKAIMYMDMNIQYFDFFKYLKQCFQGNDSLVYSFNKSLGGSMIALYAYYLSSPVNLLLFFFDNVQLFIVTATVIKLGLCGLTTAVYLRNRFTGLRPVYIVLLSLGFAMSNYTIWQSINIMWLDGVYMLPLLCLCIYRYVQTDNGRKLSLLVGIMIAVCWYISYMNCIFAVIYYIYEAFISENLRGIGKRIRHFFVFCFYEGVGVLIGGIILFPVVVEMLKGKGTRSQNIFVFTKSFLLQDLAKGFLFSQNSVISLFCGTFALIAAVAFFLCRRIRLKQKLLAAVIFLFMVLSMQIKALENIWNGFRYVAGYYCRFSMLPIFVLIVLAAAFLNGITERKDYRAFVLAGVLIECVIVWLKVSLKIDQRIFLLSSFFVFGYVVLFALLVWRKLVVLTYGAIVLFAATEMGMESRTLMKEKGRYNKNALRYLSYEKDQTAILDELEKRDGGVYRVDETKHRSDYKSKTTTYFDEGLAYGYKSIAHFSSTHDAEINILLARMGYQYLADISAYNEPILSSDSLLGLKYLLSEKTYDEYEHVFDGSKKGVYRNPYALSLAYRVSDDVLDFEEEELQYLTASIPAVYYYVHSDNPFEYQNRLYSAVLGREVKLYRPVDYTAELNEQEGSTGLSLKRNDNHVLYYGWMNADERLLAGNVYVDSEKVCQYSYWNCFATFNIGSSDTDHQLYIENYCPENTDKLKIYALDLELFKQVIGELKEHQAEVVQQSNTSLRMNYHADEEGEKLLITITADPSWRITVNGKKADAQRVCDALMVIPVEKGDNIIEMDYRYPYIYWGGVISMIGLAITMADYWLKTGRKRRNIGL